ncbi:MAG: SUMF1/EgtB/PvdO family nonheme iron enzyme [bacterium]
MMNRVPFAGMIGLLTFGLFASCGFGDVESDFEMLFGEKAREVKASTSTEDDAAFAGELLEAAGSLADEPKLQLLLYQKAYSYGSRHPAGYAAALKALELWATAAPDDLAEVRQRRLELLKARYEAARGGERKASANEYLDALLSAAEAEAQAGQPAQADALYAEAFPLASHLHSPLTSEIVRRRRALAAEVAAAKQLDEKREELQARLSANPKDTGVRKQLVILYLLDDDKPDKAKALVNGDLPATFKSCLALVTQPADETSESEALKLAEWYAQVAAKANTRTGKAIALRRAVGYYERVLELHTKQDAVRLKAVMMLAELREKARDRGIGLMPQRLTLNVTEGIPMTFVRIPGGVFVMGSASMKAGSSKRRARRIAITRDLYMGITEVTQRQYQAGNTSAVCNSGGEE